jgi:hypothetical protein
MGTTIDKTAMLRLIYHAGSEKNLVQNFHQLFFSNQLAISSRYYVLYLGAISQVWNIQRYIQNFICVMCQKRSNRFNNVNQGKQREI